jgi:hypothetical protein
MRFGNVEHLRPQGRKMRDTVRQINIAKFAHQAFEVFDGAPMVWPDVQDV